MVGSGEAVDVKEERRTESRQEEKREHHKVKGDLFIEEKGMGRVGHKYCCM